MFTKNGKIAMMLAAIHDPTANMKIKNYLGTELFAGYNAQMWPIVQNTSFVMITNSVGICVGTGTNAATEDDYSLQSMITSGLAGVVNVSYQSDNSGESMVIDLQLTNTSASEISISEVGWFGNMYGATTANGSRAQHRALIFHEVLASPFVIPAGDVRTIRIVFKAEQDNSI